MNQNEFRISDFLQEKVKQQFKELTQQQAFIEEEEDQNNHLEENHRQTQNNHKRKTFVQRKSDLNIVAMGDTNQAHLNYNTQEDLKEEDQILMKQHLKPGTFETHEKIQSENQQNQQIFVLSEKKLRQILGLEQQQTFESVQQMLDLNKFDLDCSGYPLNKNNTQELLNQGSENNVEIFLDTYDDGSQILRIGDQKLNIVNYDNKYENKLLLTINKSQLKVVDKDDNVTMATLEFNNQKTYQKINKNKKSKLYNNFIKKIHCFVC